MDQDVTCLFNQSKTICLNHSHFRSIGSLCQPFLNFCETTYCSYVYAAPQIHAYTDSATRTSEPHTITI